MSQIQPASRVQPLPMFPEIPDVIAAIVTPCQAPGEPDPNGMRQLTRTLASRGCDGLFVLGSTGEMILIDEDDRRHLVSAARDGIPHPARLLVGVGGYGPKQAIRYAKYALHDGADFVIVMAPFFQRLSQVELKAYFWQIADHSPLPVGIYHHLRMTTPVDVETLIELSQHPNIVLCKDTSNDLERIQALAANVDLAKFKILQGSERLILQSLDAGAHGCVSALSGIAPAWHRSMIDAHKAGDHQTAQQMHDRIMQLTKLFELTAVRESLAHQVHAIKYATSALGWLTTPHNLLAGSAPPESLHAEIDKIIDRAGLRAASTDSCQRES